MMHPFLISGSPDCGKSGLIYLIAQFLHSRGYGAIRNFHNALFDPTACSDIETLFEKGGRHVLLHSATDTPGCIDRLMENIADCTAPIDVLVTTCRRNDPERQYLCTRMGWTNGIVICDGLGSEIPSLPLMRIRYEAFPVALTWYQANLFCTAKHILTRHPYNL